MDGITFVLNDVLSTGQHGLHEIIRFQFRSVFECEEFIRSECSKTSDNISFKTVIYIQNHGFPL